MAKPKTIPTKVSPASFIAGIPDAAVRRDCRTLMTMMKKATGAAPKMWGPSIVGYGLRHYQYESGREGDWPVAAFSPRKGTLVVYGLLSFDRLGPLMKRLGKHKTGKSCLYIRRLEEIDTRVLERLITESVTRKTGRGDAGG